MVDFSSNAPEVNNRELLIQNNRSIEMSNPGPTSSIRTETVQSLGEEHEQDFLYYFITFLLDAINLLLFPSWFCSFLSVAEYERVLILRLGKLIGVRGPGLVRINPFTDKVHYIDLRIKTIDVPAQQMMTSDTVTVEVNCIVYIKVVDPLKAILEVENYNLASRMFAATSLRAVIGACDLDTLCVKRDGLNEQLKDTIQAETLKWGVVVTAVEVKDVVLPKNMQRAMASQAENERERRAKVVNALGEKEAATELAKAAAIISNTDGAMQLRYLHTLKNISTERNSTIIFPLPIELLGGFFKSKDVKEISKIFVGEETL